MTEQREETGAFRDPCTCPGGLDRNNGDGGRGPTSWCGKNARLPGWDTGRTEAARFLTSLLTLAETKALSPDLGEGRRREHREWQNTSPMLTSGQRRRRPPTAGASRPDTKLRGGAGSRHGLRGDDGRRTRVRMVRGKEGRTSVAPRPPRESNNSTGGPTRTPPPPPASEKPPHASQMQTAEFATNGWVTKLPLAPHPRARQGFHYSPTAPLEPFSEAGSPRFALKPSNRGNPEVAW